MSDDRNRKVLSRAVSRKLIDPQRATVVWRELTEKHGRGETTTIEDLLHERGMIDAEQRAALLVPSANQPATGGEEAQVIGDYVVVRELGSGAMGTVYLARQKRMDRLVALKVLARQYAREPLYIQRFLQEAKACGKLRHENVVAGIDVGQWKGTYFFAQEFIDGTAVDVIVDTLGTIEEETALRITLKIARALEHIAGHGLVHRDIKPENILITQTGEVKLCDFGLAKDLNTSAALTAAGTSVGTPHYIAPEQARGERNVEIRADVYGLGVSLYHMLAGAPPFDSGTPYEIMVSHIEQTFPPLEHRVQIKDTTRDLVRWMCSKAVADRPEPKALVARLEQLVSDGVVLAKKIGAGKPIAPGERPARASRAGPPPRSRGNLWLGLAAALVLACANVWFFTRTAPDDGVRDVVELGQRPSGSGPGGGSIEVTDPRAGADEATAQLARLDAQAGALPPTDPAAHLAMAARYDELAARFPARDAGKRAKDSGVQLRAAAERLGRELCAGPFAEADQLAREGRETAAAAVLDKIPAALVKGLAVANEITSRRDAWALALRGRLDVARRAVESAMSAEDPATLAKARTAVQAIARCGDPGIEGEAGKLLARLVEREGHLAARTAERAIEEYERLVDAEVLPLWRARRYADATARLDRAAVELGIPALAAEIARDLALTRTLDGVWPLVAEALGKAKAEKIAALAQTATVTKVEGEKVHVQFTLGGKAVTSSIGVRDLATADALRLASRAIRADTAAGALDLAAFAYAEGEIDPFARHLDAARGLGADVTVLERRLARVRSADREGLAREAWADLAPALEAERIAKLEGAGANALLARVKRYRELHGKTAAASAPDVAKALDEAERRLADQIVRALAGPDKPPETPVGTTRGPELKVRGLREVVEGYDVVYTFVTKEEIEDWEFENTGWKPLAGGGMSATAASSPFGWKPELRGDFEMSIQFSNATGARSLLVDLVPTDGNEAGYSVALKVTSMDLQWTHWQKKHVLLRSVGRAVEALDQTTQPARISDNDRHTLGWRRIGNRHWIRFDGKPLLTARDGTSNGLRLRLSHFNLEADYGWVVHEVRYKGGLATKAEK